MVDSTWRENWSFNRRRKSMRDQHFIQNQHYSPSPFQGRSTRTCIVRYALEVCGTRPDETLQKGIGPKRYPSFSLVSLNEYNRTVKSQSVFDMQGICKKSKANKVQLKNIRVSFRKTPVQMKNKAQSSLRRYVADFVIRRELMSNTHRRPSP